MNYRQYDELRKINELKKQEGSFVCEIVIPKDYFNRKESPASILYGNTGIIEIAMMKKTLKAIIESLDNNFPETKKIEPYLNIEMGENYKEIIKEREK